MMIIIAARAKANCFTRKLSLIARYCSCSGLMAVQRPHTVFWAFFWRGGLGETTRVCRHQSLRKVVLSRARPALTVVLLHSSGKNVGKGRGWRQGGAAPSGQAAAEAAAADPAGRRLHSNGDRCGAEITAESRNNPGTAVEQLGGQRQTPRRRRWVPRCPGLCARKRGEARQLPVLSLSLSTPLFFWSIACSFWWNMEKRYWEQQHRQASKCNYSCACVLDRLLFRRWIGAKFQRLREKSRGHALVQRR